MKPDFFENGLFVFYNQTKNMLESFQEFHYEIENLWKKKEEESNQKLVEKLKSVKEELHEEYILSEVDSSYLNQSYFPNIHRESTLISIHSYLEKRLNQLCSIVKSSLESESLVTDFNGGALKRARKYLTEVANFDFQNLEYSWNEIMKINDRRNKIVHSGDDVSTVHDISYIKSEIVEDYIKTLTEFFEKLDPQIKQFIERVESLPE